MFTFDQQADTKLFNEGKFTVQGIQEAYKAKDPRLAEYIYKTIMYDPAPESMYRAKSEGSATYLGLRQNIAAVPSRLNLSASDTASPYARKEKIWEQHQKIWAPLETEQAQKSLPERLKLHQILLELWKDDSSYAREQLISVLYVLPLVYGPWRAAKKIFKEAAERQDWEVYFILAITFHLQRTGNQWSRRFPSPKFYYSDQMENWRDIINQDHMGATYNIENAWEPQHDLKEVSVKTIQYLVRRSNRELRRLKAILPELYLEVLAQYFHIMDQHPMPELVGWLARSNKNLIFGKEEYRDYNNWWARPKLPTVYGFRSLLGQVEGLLKEEAKISFLPSLLKILENAKEDFVQEGIFSYLQTHYPREIKVLPSAVLLRMANSQRLETRNMVYNWFQNNCGVEQAKYHEHGYQLVVLAMLGRDGAEYTWEQKQFALDYIKANSEYLGEALDVAYLVWMIQSDDYRYRNLADLLLFPEDLDKSPFKASLTLPVYTSLLENSNSFSKAKEVIRKGQWTGAQNIDTNWFYERLTSGVSHLVGFVLALADADNHPKLSGWNDVWIKITRTSLADNDRIYRFAIEKLNVKVNDQSYVQSFLKESDAVTYIRRLLLHHNQSCLQAALSWVDNGWITPKEIGANFLKILSHGESQIAIADVQEFLQGEELADKNFEPSAPALLAKKVRSWFLDGNVFAFSDIGWEFLDTYSQNFKVDESASTRHKVVYVYDFVRTILKESVPFSEMVATIKTKNENKEYSGEELILARIWNTSNARTQKIQFYFDLLRYRFNLEGSLAFDKTKFGFARFTKWSTGSKVLEKRAFAQFVSSKQMSSWVKNDSIGFASLTSVLNTEYEDVHEHMRKAFFSGKDGSSIDVKLPQFTVAELFSYCFHHNPFVRRIGLELIDAHPTRFGDPDQLFLLADSKEARVRELVIRTIWRRFRSSALRDEWFPYPQSVAPISIASEQRPLRYLADPNKVPGLKPSDLKSTQKYLGDVYSAPDGSITSEQKADLQQFFRRMLFTLPAYPSAAGENPTPLRNASWKNKTTLMHAIRDVALKDRDFAELIAPVIQNFQSIKGKKLKEACLSTLVRLQASHSDLNILGGTPS